MSITLSPAVEEQINKYIIEGPYASATEVVADALALLDRRNRARAFEQSLIDADASIDRGDGIDWTPELMDQIWQEATERAALGERPSQDVCP